LPRGRLENAAHYPVAVADLDVAIPKVYVDAKLACAIGVDVITRRLNLSRARGDKGQKHAPEAFGAGNGGYSG
jgi:hypothetical protein